MCQTALALYVLICPRQFAAMSNPEDVLDKMIPNISLCSRGDGLSIFIYFMAL